MKTLMDIDYIIKENRPVIRLFYKEGVEYKEDFDPYFYAVPKNIENLERELTEFSDAKKIKKFERVKRIDLNKEIEVLKIFVYLPYDVRDIRETVKALPDCIDVREADIPFSQRYLIDSGIVPMEHAEEAGLRIAAFDIEVYNPKIAPKSDVDPIIMISYADNSNMNKVFTYKDSKQDFVVNCGSETDMIKKFIETVRERKIDILLTYNGDNFDFNYLKDRAKILNIKIDFGDESQPKELKFERKGMNFAAHITSLPHVDLFPVSRQLFNLPRYGLDNVYSEIFGEKGKDFIDKENIYLIWDSGDIENLFKYSLRDAVITLKIGESLLPLYYELSRIIKTPLYDTTRMSSGMRVEHLLISESFKKKILVPNKPGEDTTSDRTKESYTGGFVLEPKKGIHDNIVVFDFRSLYPSVIISANIDPSTLKHGNCENEKNCEKIKVDKKEYCFSREKRGFIPEILKSLVEKRIEIKKEMKKEKDPEKKKFLDVKQQALKILVNSAYGYTGFPRARWYSKECAESTTALGRKYIQDVIHEAEKNNFKVIYGDTDSVFITQKQSKEEILKNAEIFMNKINENLPEAMELDLQGFYPRGIFITKKRYAMIDEKGELIVKGLETRRRDWSNIAKKAQKEVLNLILKENNPKKAAEFVKEEIKRIKNGEVKKEELMIHTQLTRKISSYTQKKEPHVAAAERAMKKGMTFEEGDIITYIITKKGKEINEKTTIAQFVEEGDYDAEYYINNQLLPAVMRVMEACGYSEEKLKGLKEQMTLGNY